MQLCMFKGFSMLALRFTLEKQCTAMNTHFFKTYQHI